MAELATMAEEPEFCTGILLCSNGYGIVSTHINIKLPTAEHLQASTSLP